MKNKLSQHYGVKSNTRGRVKPKSDVNEITWDDLYAAVPPPSHQAFNEIKPMKAKKP